MSNNVVMQGTVWGSLCCTATMDKLGQPHYMHEDMLYKYNVDIPSIGMVDYVLSIQKCSMDAVKSNTIINAFIGSKKPTLSKKNVEEYIKVRTNSQRIIHVQS